MNVQMIQFFGKNIKFPVGGMYVPNGNYATENAACH